MPTPLNNTPRPAKQPVAYSILDLATVSQGETIKQTLNNSLALAQAAELAGYTRYWLAEHHNADSIASNAPPLLIGYVADNTTTIRVGSGGMMLPNHSPMIVAEQFGTLGQLYPGRIDLGLGRAPGTDGQTAQAIRSDFMQAAHSFPQEISKIQTYFSLANRQATVRAPVAEGTDVPLYILGSSTDSAHLAAKLGLPYAFASHFASTHLHQALKIYRDEFRPSQALAQPYIIVAINAYLADTDEQAEQLFTSLIRMFVGVLTGARQPVQPPTPMTDELEGMWQHPAVQQMLKYSFVGSKQTVKNQLQAFLTDTQADELIVASAMYSVADRIKSAQLFGDVLQELNAQVMTRAEVRL
ncbi:LLM class flavin-dependent oxidoreductase [Hymenobacter lapidiphilus]|uniref:Luciferase-like monooxygenase n=1 Tax=Hymenobacter lapidiphilus TaxID=2608003 RepID=A0A7Y7PQA8_9BACT|nr:LLM class flavin-dependent oxidoreductase [Hymenobacter lapidiphilus]NVO31882.1 LLM class flavin-dependent oxidoreductase [Hymenobacter lapidiphilus]